MPDVYEPSSSGAGASQLAISPPQPDSTPSSPQKESPKSSDPGSPSGLSARMEASHPFAALDEAPETADVEPQLSPNVPPNTPASPIPSPKEPASPKSSAEQVQDDTLLEPNPQPSLTERLRRKKTRPASKVLENAERPPSFVAGSPQTMQRTWMLESWKGPKVGSPSSGEAGPSSRTTPTSPQPGIRKLKSPAPHDDEEEEEQKKERVQATNIS